MAKAVIEETALATRTEESTELSTTAMAATVQAEVQAAVILAKKFPRNEDEAYSKLMKACKRTSFADDAAYSFPRGGTSVSGPSINLARESARVWGNIESGTLITHDDEDTRTIRTWAWDKETNVRVFAEDTFKKLIFRKKDGWITPDERDLRELTNRRAAILKRNCLLELIPKDFIEDAMRACKATLESETEQDPDGARKRLIVAFAELNITPDMLEKKLGHPLAQSSPTEVAELRKIYTSIRDGNSTWAEYAGEGSEKPKGKEETGSLSMEDLKPAPEKPVEKPQEPSAFISAIEAGDLQAVFKDALPTKHRRIAEKMLADWLKTQNIEDVLKIRKDSYGDVKEAAIAFAKEFTA